MSKKVDAVIVTFNRLAKLKRALDCYDKQTFPFRNLIVVDNCSTDGTDSFLNEWKSLPSSYGKHVLSLKQNTGGSGGFYEGKKFALSLQPDWVYIADDDAYPEERMMEKFLDFYSKHSSEKMSAICAVVTDINGDIIADCRSHFSVDEKQFCQCPASQEEYAQPYFSFNCLSYVGAFLSGDALREVGLVNSRFFIYQDDVEHSIRLSNYGIMYCVSDMVVVHDSVPLTDMTPEALSKVLWKEYYAARNRLYMLMNHYPSMGRKAVLSVLNGIHAHKRSTLSAVDKMVLEGCRDAIIGKLGIHDVYRPGLQVLPETHTTLPYPAMWWEFVYWLLRIRRIFIKG